MQIPTSTTMIQVWSVVRKYKFRLIAYEHGSRTTAKIYTISLISRLGSVSQTGVIVMAILVMEILDRSF